MSFDTHNNLGYSLIQTVISQNSTTIVFDVLAGHGARFSTGQQITIWPASQAAALLDNSMICRVTGITSDQITADITSGSREGTNVLTIQQEDQVANTVTKKALTDIEAAVNTNTSNIATNTTNIGTNASNIATITGLLPGSSIVGVSDTQTLSNKRIKRRVVTVTQSATPAIDTDNMDIASITGLAQAITSMTTNLTGTPVDGDSLIINITDNGTARGITWGASFESSGNVTLPSTTVISTRLDVAFLWNTATSKWRCVGVS